MKSWTDRELKEASLSQLNGVCEELRREIFSTVSECGGHLSSNLGAVELTVALHRVFDFPRDKIVFDVGHQCYAHKLLSGRAEQFHTLRKRGGISGFPKREESEYDCYNTGHAGTAVSAALGLSKARDLNGENFDVIALVGDGAFNNGLIYEALSSLKILNSRILIILNDNGMSISPTVGGMHEILNNLKSSSKDFQADFEGGDPDVRVFERFGLKYMGVVDGNDLKKIVPALSAAKDALKEGSVLLHVTTKKGCGYPFCENAPMETHGVSPSGSAKKEYSAALGEELMALAGKDEKIVAVTAAMTDSLGLRPFFEKYPDRGFDVGICEEHAAVLCASMAAGGMKPYFAIYSTFLQRAFDEIIHDICAQKLPVTFCIDRAGVSGADGETHQGVFDLSFLSMIPNLTVAIPKDIGEFRAMIRRSADFRMPLAIRYPREGTEGEISEVEIGKFEVLHSTMSDIVLLAAGERCLKIAWNVREMMLKAGVDVMIVNARFLRPLDEELLSELKERDIYTIEDNVKIGGLGDAVARFYRQKGLKTRVRSFGFEDGFIPHGTPAELMEEFGLSAKEIAKEIISRTRSRGKE